MKGRPKIVWTLTITTFRGTDLVAIHFYGRLRAKGFGLQDVERASQLGSTIRLESKAEVIKEAKKWLGKNYKGRWRLVVSDQT